MVTNKVAKKATVIQNATPRLVYCKDCGSRESWQRYPERDVKFDRDTNVGGSDSVVCCPSINVEPCPESGLGNLPETGELKIFEYAYKCRICNKITWYPYEPELKIKRG